jgi:outer membrane protein
MKVLPILTLALLFGSALSAGMSLSPAESVQANRPPSISPPNGPAGPLDLDEAIRIALANNPELVAARHDADAARSRRDGAFAQRMPRLSWFTDYNHHTDNQRLVFARYNGEPGVFSRDVLRGELRVDLPIFTGGRLSNRSGAADLRSTAAEYQAARSADELVFQVSSVFNGILAARRVVDALEFSAETLEAHLRQVGEMIAAQKAAEVDRLRTEVRLADIRQRLIQARNAERVRTRVLANLIGLEDAAGQLSVRGELEFEDAPQTISLERELESALAQRSDYLAAELEERAQTRIVKSIRAERWPAVYLQGGYGGRWALDTVERPPGADSLENLGRVGFAVEIPVFEGGRIAARVGEERAKLNALSERLRRSRLQIGLEVETAVLNISAAGDRVLATRTAIEQARVSLEIEREKYRLGKGAVIDVLDAQSALLEAQTIHHLAIADYHTARAELRFAKGEKP